MNVIMHDNGCTGAAMQVIDSDGTTVLATLCDGVLSRDEYLSSGDRLTLSVFTMGGNSSILNFTAHYTSFTEDCKSLDDDKVERHFYSWVAQNSFVGSLELERSSLFRSRHYCWHSA